MARFVPRAVGYNDAEAESGRRGEAMALIYIVEDDAALRGELAHLLELSGFETAACETFAHAADDIRAAAPDCVVLDLKLPGTDGHAICRDLRASGFSAPIIMITSSDSEFDEVMGMNLGADDYVTKPYSPAVLLARVQALLRRSAGGHADMRIECKGVVLDIAAGTVSYQGKSAELTRNELKILHILMRNRGTVLARHEIMCDLWESDAFIDDNTLTVNVNRLRKTLSSVGVPDDFLVTRRGLGYMV